MNRMYFLLLLLLSSGHCNMYSETSETCSAAGKEDCGCSSLKRDATQQSRGASEDQYADGVAAKVWELYIGAGSSRTEEYGTRLTSLLAQYNVQTVLDAAAGTGVDSVLLVEAGFNVNSIDASDRMLKYAHKVRWERRKDPGFDDWKIGEGNWLDLTKVEETITHPEGGYDAVICLGNSFAHLPSQHNKAISNFYNVLSPGGILLIDHRNFDYILEHGVLPNSNSKLYYQGDRIHKISTSVIRIDNIPSRIELNYEIDVSGFSDGSEERRKLDDGTEIPVEQFQLSYYPHTVTGFQGMLREVFGEKARYTLLKDWLPELEDEEITSYYIHVIQKL